MDIKEKLKQYIKDNKEDNNLLSKILKKKSKSLNNEYLLDEEECILEEKNIFMVMDYIKPVHFMTMKKLV